MQRFRVMELTGTRLNGVVKTELVAIPVMIICSLLFSELKGLCALTDGNLSRHLKVLQETGLVEVWKGFHHNRPQTLCRMTSEGRARFLEYISVLEQVIADTSAAEAHPQPARKYLEGWSPA